MVDVRIDLDPCQPGLQLLERALDAARHVQCVEARELLYRNHQTGLFADDGVSDQLLMAIQHMRDFANAHGRAGNRYLGKGLRGRDWQLVTNIESLVRRLDEAAGTRR